MVVSALIHILWQAATLVALASSLATWCWQTKNVSFGGMMFVVVKHNYTYLLPVPAHPYEMHQQPKKKTAGQKKMHPRVGGP